MHISSRRFPIHLSSHHNDPTIFTSANCSEDRFTCTSIKDSLIPLFQEFGFLNLGLSYSHTFDLPVFVNRLVEVIQVLQETIDSSISTSATYYHTNTSN